MGRDWILVQWSDRARAHALEKHGVTEREIQEMFDRGVILRYAAEDRIAAYGETVAGRLMTAILEQRGGEYWLVTIRKMEPRERIYYVTKEGYGDR